MKEILRKLAQSVGISGHEEKLLNVYREIFKNMDVSISTDKNGNIIVYKKGNKKGKIVLSAHNDEIGLMVTKIDNGYIRFTKVGGYDEKILLGQEVVVFGDKEYTGIIGAKPPHLLTKDDMEKMIPMKDLYVDIGMNDDKKLKKHIKIGDRISLKSKFTELQNNFVSCKSFDNRACCAVIIKAFMNLKKYKDLMDLYLVFTSQEEETGMGAKTSAYEISPDIAIVTDVCVAKQTEVLEGAELDEVAIGKGSNIHPKLFYYFKNICDEEKIKYSIESLPVYSGTDTGTFQLSRSGVSTCLISLPLRNMHTPVEIASIDTMEAMAKLISIGIQKMELEDFSEKIIK